MNRQGIQAAERLLIDRINPRAPSRRTDKRARKWGSRAAASVVATAIGVWMGFVAWPLYLEYRDRQPPKPDAPSLTAAPAIPLPAAAPDVGTSVLGTASSIAETQQQFVLVGTTPGQTAVEGTALIGTDPRNPQTFGVGSILANGAVVEEIYADHIVLSMRGRRSSVKVDREAPARFAMREALSKSKNSSPTVIESLSIPTGVDPATLIGGPQTARRPIERVPTSRDDFSEVMRSQVVIERDKVAGLKIFRGSHSAAFEQLGLQDGDIVRSVNGKPVVEVGAWQAIDDSVSTGSSIVVGIERDGSLISVLLDGAKLNAAEPVTAPPVPLPKT